MTDTIYLPNRPYEMLEWLCSVTKEGEWHESPAHDFPGLKGSSEASRLILTLQRHGCVETRLASVYGRRAARVLIRHDDPRIQRYDKRMAESEFLRPLMKKPRKLIPYAGAEKAQYRDAVEADEKPRKLVPYAGQVSNRGGW